MSRFVVGLYLVGALAFLSGLAVVVSRLLGWWIEAPVEAFIAGGFLSMIGAKAIAVRTGRAAHG